MRRQGTSVDNLAMYESTFIANSIHIILYYVYLELDVRIMCIKYHQYHSVIQSFDLFCQSLLVIFFATVEYITRF